MNADLADAHPDDRDRTLEQTLDQVKDVERRIAAVADSTLAQPSTLLCTLHDYQLVGLRWLAALHQCGLNGVLADEGLIDDAQHDADMAMRYDGSLTGRAPDEDYKWKDHDWRDHGDEEEPDWHDEPRNVNPLREPRHHKDDVPRGGLGGGDGEYESLNKPPELVGLEEKRHLGKGDGVPLHGEAPDPQK